MNTDYCLNDWIVKPQRGCIERGGTVVRLAPKSMAVLQCLARASGEVVSRQELFDTIWPGAEITDDALTQRVVELRKAFGDSAHLARFIETIPKIGFRLIPPVTPLPAEAGQEPAARGMGSLRRTVTRTSALILGTILALLAMYWYLSGHQGIYELATTEEIPSIAVLPFVNMSDDASNEYFSDGISEELLSMLAKIPELSVISRTSAFTYKGKDFDTPTIARQLDVDHLLEGSVRKSGNRVRITAQLIEARSDTHLWSETYDRTLDDIFATQNEIAAAVVDELKPALLGEIPLADQIDPEAYALYLQAMYFRQRGTVEAYRQSLALLKQVLAVAPNYARAWLALGTNYIDQLSIGLKPLEEGSALAREAINHALSLDPNMAMGHSSLGWITMTFDGDLDHAAQHFEQALSLEPTNLVVILQSADLMETLGRLDETILLLEHVATLDPVNPTSHANLGKAYFWAGRFDEAIASMRTVLTLSQASFRTHYRIGEALLLKNEPEAALTEFMQEPMEVFRLIGQVMAYDVLGRRAEAKVTLNTLIAKHERAASYNIACIHALRGNLDRAFTWLDKAALYNDTGLHDIGVNSMFANLYDDPRWLSFLERLGKSPEKLATIEFSVVLPD